MAIPNTSSPASADDKAKKPMREGGPDIARMLQEEAAKAAPVLKGEKQPDAAKKTESAIGDLIKAEMPAQNDNDAEKPLDLKAMAAEKSAIDRVVDAGTAAVGEIEDAYANGKLEELGPVLEKFLATAKNNDVDAAQARAALKGQLEAKRDLYFADAKKMTARATEEKDKATAYEMLDAEKAKTFSTLSEELAAEARRLDTLQGDMDSFAKGLEKADSVNSEEGQNFLALLEADRYADMGEFDIALEKRVKSTDNKIPGMEINLIRAAAEAHFKEKVDEIKATQVKEGTLSEASDAEVDDVFENMFDDTPKKTGTD